MAKTFHFRTRYMNDNGIVEIGKYQNGTIAIRLASVYGEALGTPTVNLEDYNETPQEGHVFIKNYSENEGVYENLVKLGIISESVREVKFGPYKTTAHECKLLLAESDMRAL